jgi:hypothetical protein
MPMPPRLRRSFLAALAIVAGLAVVPAAGAVTSASYAAKSGCDLKVINDWADNGRVDGTYAIPCYTQAIQRLNSLPDIRGYSSAIDDIHDALLAAIRQDRGGGGPSGGGSSGGGGGGSDGRSGTSPGPGNGSTQAPDKSPIESASHTIGPSNATSIPLPLIVLGGLALLLLLAAAGTWIARRVQSRRVTPAPQPRP